jgi:hypothetical protein
MRMNTFCVLFVLLISLSYSVSALGVSPAGKTINFEPGQTVPLDFFIINSEGNELDVSLSGVGSLSESLFFENSRVHVNQGDYRTPIRAAITLPQSLEPGLHTVFIRITPVFESNGGFSAYVSPEIPVTIRVPYPDKYAVVDVSILSVDEGTFVPINLEFDNLGSRDIQRAGGSIAVYSINGKLLNQMSVPEISIAANSFGKTEGTPKVALPRGSYYLEANAYYDEVSVNILKNFSIGEAEAELLSLLTSSIVAGQINEVKFRASLDWNIPVEASLVTNIGSVEAQTPVFELRPGESEVSAFVDATNIGRGERNLKARLVYGSQIREFNFDIKVVEEGESEEGSLTWVWIVLLIMALIALVVFLYFRYKKGGQGPSEVQNAPPSVPPPANPSSETQTQIVETFK